jgi:hypothetical protein
MLRYYEKFPQNVFLSFRYSKNTSSIKEYFKYKYWLPCLLVLHGLGCIACSGFVYPSKSWLGVLSIFVPDVLNSVQLSISCSLAESWRRVVLKSRTKACACTGIHTASGQDEESFHLPSVVSQTEFWSTPWALSSNLCIWSLYLPIAWRM